MANPSQEFTIAPCNLTQKNLSVGTFKREKKKKNPRNCENNPTYPNAAQQSTNPTDYFPPAHLAFLENNHIVPTNSTKPSKHKQALSTNKKQKKKKE